MDAIFEMQAAAGQVVMEESYGAKFVWNNLEVVCTHDGVMQNPPLMEGGFSPNTQTQVVIRRSLITSTNLPKKGENCVLKVSATKSFSLRVQTVTTSPGNLFLTILCMDANQGA